MNSRLLQNKKGITPIISVILLLMMTIAIAGLAYGWLNRMQTTITTSSENTSGKFLKGMNVQLRIDGYNTSCGGDSTVIPTVFVRNSGTETAANLQLYVDDSLIQGSANASLSAGTTTQYVLSNQTCNLWVNRSKTIKIASDETSAEATYSVTCTTSQLC
jgi:flagellin-like protein